MSKNDKVTVTEIQTLYGFGDVLHFKKGKLQMWGRFIHFEPSRQNIMIKTMHGAIWKSKHFYYSKVTDSKIIDSFAKVKINLLDGLMDTKFKVCQFLKNEIGVGNSASDRLASLVVAELAIALNDDHTIKARKLAKEQANANLPATTKLQGISEVSG